MLTPTVIRQDGELREGYGQTFVVTSDTDWTEAPALSIGATSYGAATLVDARTARWNLTAAQVSAILAASSVVGYYVTTGAGDLARPIVTGQLRQALAGSGAPSVVGPVSLIIGPPGAAGDLTTVADGAIPQAKVNGLASALSSLASSIASVVSSLSSYVLGTDSRLSDSRTPTAHAASHASAGSDAVTVAQSQVSGLSSSLAAKADLALMMGVANQSATTIDTIPRTAVNTSNGQTSGNLYLACFTAPVSITVTSLTMVTAATASSGLTLARMGIYSYDETTATLLGATANDTSLFGTTYTAHTRTLAASVALTAGSRYAVAVLCVGTTPPVLLGTINSSAVAAMFALPPKVGLYATGQTDLPASISALTVSPRNNYARLA